MIRFKFLQDTLQYVWEGGVRIFSPTKDEYPKTGVQPFAGEPFKEK
jgi:hypothetical protein